MNTWYMVPLKESQFTSTYTGPKDIAQLRLVNKQGEGGSRYLEMILRGPEK